VLAIRYGLARNQEGVAAAARGSVVDTLCGRQERLRLVPKRGVEPESSNGSSNVRGRDRGYSTGINRRELGREIPAQDASPGRSETRRQRLYRAHNPHLPQRRTRRIGWWSQRTAISGIVTLLRRSPRRLLIVATGNITNKDLLALFGDKPETVVDGLGEARFVELGPSGLVIHHDWGSGAGAQAASVDREPG
jgi:hypothetical protein